MKTLIFIFAALLMCILWAILWAVAIACIDGSEQEIWAEIKECIHNQYFKKRKYYKLEKIVKKIRKKANCSNISKIFCTGRGNDLLTVLKHSTWAEEYCPDISASKKEYMQFLYRRLIKDLLPVIEKSVLNSSKEWGQENEVILLHILAQNGECESNLPNVLIQDLLKTCGDKHVEHIKKMFNYYKDNNPSFYEKYFLGNESSLKARKKSIKEKEAEDNK